MAVVGTFRSGKDARVQVDGANLNLGNWDYTHHADDLDNVNFESNGLDQGIIGVEGADANFDGFFDHGVNPADDPPGVYPRDDLPNVNLYTNVDDDLYCSLPLARCLSIKINTAVRDQVKFAATCKSQAEFSDPTGSV